jgi:hypothetical protein
MPALVHTKRRPLCVDASIGAHHIHSDMAFFCVDTRIGAELSCFCFDALQASVGSIKS